ncbi:MAG TPA: class I SAM-dependent methyltransferase [Candidatus Dormibacteraeota bacterium]|nr:class I SAM-dependent methyltransferase [Candidatus Dormibacteraeota bacterium]
MANNLASLMFRAMYRFGFKPWDSGIPPPELKELIEGPQARAPGKALDLGCGTGTNTMYMAQHGWDVTGIDFVSTAIEAARKKVQAANVTPRLIQGDVTRLKELSIGVGYSLVFDLGCLHSIPEARRDGYAAGVNEVTVPGADFLVWGFYAKPNFFVNAKLAQNELEERFGRSWDMVRAWGGEQPDRFPGRWYHLRRRS